MTLIGAGAFIPATVMVPEVVAAPSATLVAGVNVKAVGVVSVAPFRVVLVNGMATPPTFKVVVVTALFVAAAL